MENAKFTIYLAMRRHHLASNKPHNRSNSINERSHISLIDDFLFALNGALGFLNTNPSNFPSNEGKFERTAF